MSSLSLGKRHGLLLVKGNEPKMFIPGSCVLLAVANISKECGIAGPLASNLGRNIQVLRFLLAPVFPEFGPLAGLGVDGNGLSEEEAFHSSFNLGLVARLQPGIVEDPTGQHVNANPGIALLLPVILVLLRLHVVVLRLVPFVLLRPVLLVLFSNHRKVFGNLVRGQGEEANSREGRPYPPYCWKTLL